MGFAQVGHESDWRTASTKSAQDVFSEENGYQLSFIDCDNDSATQLEAVRGFIQGRGLHHHRPHRLHRLGLGTDRV